MFLLCRAMERRRFNIFFVFDFETTSVCITRAFTVTSYGGLRRITFDKAL